MNKISKKNKIKTKWRTFCLPWVSRASTQCDFVCSTREGKAKLILHKMHNTTQHNWNLPLHRHPHVQRSPHHSHSPPSLYPQKNVSRENFDKNENNNKKLRILGSTLRHLLQMEKVGQKYKWLRREFGQFWDWNLLWWRRACVYYSGESKQSGDCFHH